MWVRVAQPQGYSRRWDTHLSPPPMLFPIKIVIKVEALTAHFHDDVQNLAFLGRRGHLHNGLTGQPSSQGAAPGTG